MNPALARLFAMLRGREILREGFFAKDNVDAILNERDEPEFDSAWVTCNRAVEKSAKSIAIGTEALATIDAIREAAFFRICELTPNREIPAYVCDDFGLIALALATGYSDAWLNALLAAYVDGRFPRGVLTPISGRLVDQLDRTSATDN